MSRLDPARLTAPAPLAIGHRIDGFACGRKPLDDWLRRHALRNQETGASRTYVVCDGREVVAWYALAVGAVIHAAAPGRVRRNMPEPVRVMILARLAVDERWHGHGLGRALEGADGHAAGRPRGVRDLTSPALPIGVVRKASELQ